MTSSEQNPHHLQPGPSDDAPPLFTAPVGSSGRSGSAQPGQSAPSAEPSSAPSAQHAPSASAA
ncbi:hypothetical protein, partial [Desertihabitans aurantiacus]|uniref:hypothetical protein n=1 Tax=Desertihabitans aurantiacus TaxID=2282477 RepID=UPI001E5B5D29